MEEAGACGGPDHKTDQGVKHVAHFEQAELGHGRQHDRYEPAVPMRVPTWLQGVAA